MPDICHVFVCVEPGSPGIPGLDESFRREHPGQGTANLCHVFDNAYLELLWATDVDDLASPPVAPTGLAQRLAWRRTGACPFGIGLRGPGALPFATWDYRAPFLPAGMAIAVAEDSRDPVAPFLFQSPGTARPDAWTDGRAGARQRPSGLAEIARVRLAGPRLGPALRTLEAAGVLELEEAGPWRMTLTLSRVDGTAPRSLVLPMADGDRCP